jgi:hypothetical protein
VTHLLSLALNPAKPLLSLALNPAKPLSILDLKGLGREEWRGTSAASHVHDERDS